MRIVGILSRYVYVNTIDQIILQLFIVLIVSKFQINKEKNISINHCCINSKRQKTFFKQKLFRLRNATRRAIIALFNSLMCCRFEILISYEKKQCNQNVFV